jgi:hypothetical protein
LRTKSQEDRVVCLVRSLIARGSGYLARPTAFCTVSALAIAAGLGLAWPGSQAQAACAPPTGAGTPSNDRHLQRGDAQSG